MYISFILGVSVTSCLFAWLLHYELLHTPTLKNAIGLTITTICIIIGFFYVVVKK
jgi:hypothetical protein